MLSSWLIALTSHLLLGGMTVIALIPMIVFCIECLVGVFAPLQEHDTNAPIQPRLKVLVPAHNEADHIHSTLEALISEVLATDSIFVIADNCTDNTADIARSYGTTVLERQDANHPGKGYALDFALQTLQADPPEVIIVIDADCRVTPGTIALLAQKAVQEQRPIQATYLMEAAEIEGLTDRISAFAIKVRNLVRSVGITQLGYPCLLAGSGMAFPWDILQQVSLAGSKCVDDMQLTIDLAIAGHTPTYTTAGRVIGRLMQNQAAQSQRSRWEHGHLQVIFTQVPKLLRESWRQKRLSLVMLALDLSVPPLSLLVVLWFLTFSLSIVATFLGLLAWQFLAVLGLAGGMLGFALGSAWVKFGRHDLPLQILLAIPVYILWKLPIYLNFWVQPQTQWLKTERDIDPTPSKQ